MTFSFVVVAFLVANKIKIPIILFDENRGRVNGFYAGKNDSHKFTVRAF